MGYRHLIRMISLRTMRISGGESVRGRKYIHRDPYDGSKECNCAAAA